MTKQKKSTNIWHWKKITFICFSTFVATLLEIIWATKDYANNNSSLDLSTHLYERAFIFSLFTVLFIILSLIKQLLQKIDFHIVTHIILLIIFWTIWNYEIFIEYEANWSTYSCKESIFYTFQISLLPISSLSIGLYLLLRWFLNSKDKPKK